MEVRAVGVRAARIVGAVGVKVLRASAAMILQVSIML
jgi:hypothetical protein